MNWVSRDGKYISHPYSLIAEVRGYSAWIQTETRYANLGRELSLDKAKALCEQHRAKEVA
jgi:hypothetical protein